MSESCSVTLPHGRTQHAKYHSNEYDGFVADVTFDGTAVCPDIPVYAVPVVKTTPAHTPPVLVHATPGLAHTSVVANTPVVDGPVIAAGCHARLAGQVSHNLSPNHFRKNTGVVQKCMTS